jgi:hypothetical protein
VIGNEFVALAVVVAHHTVGDPGNDLLVAVLVHLDEGAGIHERLDDGRERTVPVVVVVGDGTAREIEVDSKLALILRDIRSWLRIDPRVCLCGRRVVHCPA